MGMCQNVGRRNRVCVCVLFVYASGPPGYYASKIMPLQSHRIQAVSALLILACFVVAASSIMHAYTQTHTHAQTH